VWRFFRCRGEEGHCLFVIGGPICFFFVLGWLAGHANLATHHRRIGEGIAESPQMK
jgi:hypothetical protein